MSSEPAHGGDVRYSEVLRPAAPAKGPSASARDKTMAGGASLLIASFDRVSVTVSGYFTSVILAGILARYGRYPFVLWVIILELIVAWYLAERIVREFTSSSSIEAVVIQAVASAGRARMTLPTVDEPDRWDNVMARGRTFSNMVVLFVVVSISMQLIERAWTESNPNGMESIACIVCAIIIMFTVMERLKSFGL